MSFFEELRRRNVIRVGIAYLIVAWLVIQVADVMIDNIGAPDWLFRGILLVLGIGFLIAMFIAWAFELTPEGLKREADVDRSRSAVTQTGKKLNNAILVLAIIAAGYFFWESRIRDTASVEPADQVAVEQITENTPAPTSAETPGEVTIAVLPFVNMSSDPEQEYFSDGITEEILNVLAKVEGLRVTSRSSAFSLKGQNLDIPTIADRLGVAHVLEGSVRKAGNQVRVTAQLIRVSDDSHLWSETFDRELDNIFAIQDEISRAIAGALRVELGNNPDAYRPPTDNIQAYELYLRGRELQSTRIIANLVTSMDLFQQALDLDPEFANASGQMAMSAYLLGSRRQAKDTGIGFNDAERLAMQTLELDPGNSLALIVMSQIGTERWEWKRPAELLEQALKTKGSEAAAEYWNGLFWLSAGFVERSQTFLQAAEAKDPLSANVWRWMSRTLDALGEYEKAVEYMDKAVQVDQGFPHSVALFLVAAGQADKAVAYFAEHTDESEDIQAAFDEVLLNDDPGPFVATLEPDDHETRAWVFQRTGRHAEAMEMLRRMNESGLVTRIQIHMMNHFWNSTMTELRQLPEFKAFIKDIGLLEFWQETGFPPLCRPLGEQDFECD